MIRPEPQAPEASPGPILVIEAPAALALAARYPDDRVVVARYASLDPQLIARVRPAWIIAPLFGIGFDATNVLDALEQCAFAGRIAIAAPRLPNPRMVERELSAFAPALAIEVVQIA